MKKPTVLMYKLLYCYERQVSNLRCKLTYLKSIRPNLANLHVITYVPIVMTHLDITIDRTDRKLAYYEKKCKELYSKVERTITPDDLGCDDDLFVADMGEYTPPPRYMAYTKKPNMWELLCRYQSVIYGGVILLIVLSCICSLGSSKKNH